MSLGTPIQWCDDSANPTMGCDGCELWNPALGVRRCYAGVLHLLRGGHPGYAPEFEHVSLFPGRMLKAAALPSLVDRARPEKPWLDGAPRTIFVSDMSDALSDRVSFDYLEAEIINAVDTPSGSRHRWMWLTKRPQRMAEFGRWLRKRGRPWPTNLWAGTSVTTQHTATMRIPALLAVGNDQTRRFLSVEPQWGCMDLSTWLVELDMVIQGGESGKEAHAFDLAWARDLRDACSRARVPYFLKQLGAHVVFDSERIRLEDSRHGGDWDEWPTDLRVRQVLR